MNIDPGAGEICLGTGHLLKLSEARGVIVRCTAGTLWITVAGLRDDRCLRPGQSFRIPNERLALIEGVDHGCLCLEDGETRPANSLALANRIHACLRKQLLARIRRTLNQTGRAASAPDCRA